MPDRIEAGTFMIAAAITKGDLLLENCPEDALDAVISKIKEMGVTAFPTMMFNNQKHMGFKPAEEIIEILRSSGSEGFVKCGEDDSEQLNTGCRKTERNESFVKTGDNIKMIICMAGWCGHCQALKKSGELEKLMQMIGKDNVIIVDEKDQGAGNMMKALGVRGFPAIMIVDMGNQGMPRKLADHNGQRTAQSMADALMKHKGHHQGGHHQAGRPHIRATLEKK